MGPRRNPNALVNWSSRIYPELKRLVALSDVAARLHGHTLKHHCESFTKLRFRMASAMANEKKPARAFSFNRAGRYLDASNLLVGSPRRKGKRGRKNAAPRDVPLALDEERLAVMTTLFAVFCPG